MLDYLALALLAIFAVVVVLINEKTKHDLAYNRRFLAQTIESYERKLVELKDANLAEFRLRCKLIDESCDVAQQRFELAAMLAHACLSPSAAHAVAETMQYYQVTFVPEYINMPEIEAATGLNYLLTLVDVTSERELPQLKLMLRKNLFDAVLGATYSVPPQP